VLSPLSRWLSARFLQIVPVLVDLQPSTQLFCILAAKPRSERKRLDNRILVAGEETLDNLLLTHGFRIVDLRRRNIERATTQEALPVPLRSNKCDNLPVAVEQEGIAWRQEFKEEGEASILILDMKLDDTFKTTLLDCDDTSIAQMLPHEDSELAGELPIDGLLLSLINKTWQDDPDEPLPLSWRVDLESEIALPFFDALIDLVQLGRDKALELSDKAMDLKPPLTTLS
jgi:hypothetical protein